MMLWLCLGGLGLFLILMLACVRVPLDAAEEVPVLQRPFRRIAEALLRRRRTAGSYRVREDLRTLGPSRASERRIREHYVRKTAYLLMFLFMALFLAAAAAYAARRDGFLDTESGEALRAGYGEESRVLHLEEESHGAFDVTVRPREYTPAESAALAEQAFDSLAEQMPGDNPDLMHVRTALSLPTTAAGGTLPIRWESSLYERVARDGRVFPPAVGEPAEDVVLTAQIRSGDETYSREFAVRVLPAEPAREEMERMAIEEALAGSEAATRTDAAFRLPASAGGIPLSWSEVRQDLSLFILVLLAGAGLFQYMAADRELHRQIIARERQMTLDYPQIAGKLVLYIGAGMSVRSVFRKIGRDYEEQRAAGGEKRAAYEEVLLMCHELESGIPETAAYGHFAVRCRSGRYAKLSSILSQNLRKGNDLLLTALQEEAASAFEERKQIARQLGEEAGTKLLLPMIIMLAVTMVMIMVPAYIGFAV